MSSLTACNEQIQEIYYSLFNYFANNFVEEMLKWALVFLVTLVERVVVFSGMSQFMKPRHCFEPQLHGIRNSKFISSGKL